MDGLHPTSAHSAPAAGMVTTAPEVNSSGHVANNVNGKQWPYCLTKYVSFVETFENLASTSACYAPAQGALSDDAVWRLSRTSGRRAAVRSASWIGWSGLAGLAQGCCCALPLQAWGGARPYSLYVYEFYAMLKYNNSMSTHFVHIFFSIFFNWPVSQKLLGLGHIQKPYPVLDYGCPKLTCVTDCQGTVVLFQAETFVLEKQNLCPWKSLNFWFGIYYEPFNRSARARTDSSPHQMTSLNKMAFSFR